MKPEEYYCQKINEFQQKLKKTGRKRNVITAGKLLFFIGIGICLYFFAISRGWGMLGMAIGGITGFIALSVYEVKVLLQLKRYETVICCYRTELSYLAGELVGLETGSKYRQAGHPYAVDLDIIGENSLFQHVNRTVTRGGEKRLAEWLLNLCREGKEIRERQQAVKELAEYPDWCGEFRVRGKMYAGGEESVDFQSWLKAPDYFSGRKIRAGVYLLNALTVVLWLATLFSGVFFLFALSASFVQLGWVMMHFRRMSIYNEHLDGFLKMISVYLFLAEQIVQEEFEAERLKRLKEQLSGERDALKAFRLLKRRLSRFEQRGNLLIATILNGLYMDTFYAVRSLEQWKRKYGESIVEWTESIHETDALVSMAYYHYNHPGYIFPVLNEEKWLYAVDIGHPLLPGDGGVRNDFTVEKVHELFVITGANMAGKSTFLRTVGVNLVLALSGNVVCSRHFEFSLMDVFTSMRTTDNLSQGTSYFHAELLRLKQLIEQAERSERLFIILDEMLKGTNSCDKLNGSLKFLQHLLHYPVSGIVATHDLALGDLAAQYPEHFYNYCFEITHSDEDIHYDYKLKPGISRNMNASVLLRQMGLIS